MLEIADRGVGFWPVSAIDRAVIIAPPREFALNIQDDLDGWSRRRQIGLAWRNGDRTRTRQCWGGALLRPRRRNRKKAALDHRRRVGTRLQKQHVGQDHDDGAHTHEATDSVAVAPPPSLQCKNEGNATIAAIAVSFAVVGP